MNDKCFEIGAIQAFLDGEAAPELSFGITNHAAACDKCALAIAEAEEENAQVFAMLDRELNSLVPTQRLWSNISVALAEEKSQISFWGKVRAFVLTVFASPSLTVAAAALIVFGLFAAVWSLRSPAEVQIAGVTQPSNDTVQSTANPIVQPVDSSVVKDVVVPPTKNPEYIKETNHSPEKLRKMITNTKYTTTADRPKVSYAIEEYLPGEESYVRTIAGLKENVDAKKDLIMNPSTRVSFERDLAVVDDSIKKMKEVVRKNPKNQAAKQVLYSSYQNKIDLLNSVVEREELMASLSVQ